MTALTAATSLVRDPSDPKVVETGPSSVLAVDSLAKALGWFSFALGVAELVAAGQITRSLGLEGKEGVVRAFGVREIMAGVPTLSVDKQVGLASRLVGDVIDIATLLPALREDNPKRGNAMLALAAVGAVTLLDVVAFSGVRDAHDRNRGQTRDYSDRSGFPRGIAAARQNGAQATRAEPTEQQRRRAANE